MNDRLGTSRLSPEEVLNVYFLEHRAKLIDIAAFLDRFDRAQEQSSRSSDMRMQAFRDALHLLLDDQPHRAKRVLELFSDPSSEPIATAPMKGALGAYPRSVKR